MTYLKQKVRGKCAVGIGMIEKCIIIQAGKPCKCSASIQTYKNETEHGSWSICNFVFIHFQYANTFSFLYNRN